MSQCEVLLIATPPAVIFDVIDQLGDVSGKVIIDATNSVRQKPEPYDTVYHALADKTNAEVVKCFNTTGFENLLNPVYHDEKLDMFMAGDSKTAKRLPQNWRLTSVSELAMILAKLIRCNCWNSLLYPGLTLPSCRGRAGILRLEL